MTAHPRPNQRPTLRDVVQAAAQRLAAAGADAPRLSAELCAAHALGLDRVGLLTGAERPLTEAETEAVAALVARREAGEPAAYILGRKEFYSLDLAVGPGVLVPRPESELLVDMALEAFGAEADIRAADLGTGSGALAVALAVHRPRARVLALDASAEALAWAEGNVARHGVQDRVRLVRADFTEPLVPTLAQAGSLDLVLANPPYVSEAEYAELDPGVRDFEPRAALLGPEEGLWHLRRLAPHAGAALRPGGLLLVEIGWTQGDAAKDVLAAAGYVDARIYRDLAGRPRVACGRAPDKDSGGMHDAVAMSGG